MKNFWILLLVVSAACTCGSLFSENRLKSSLSKAFMPASYWAFQDLFNYRFDQDNKYVYLTTTISNEIVFSTEYLPIHEDGKIGVQINLKPVNNLPIVRKDGSKLLEISLRVMLENEPAKGILIKETTTGTYQVADHTVKNSYFSARELKGLTVEISQDPIFPRTEQGYDRFIKMAMFKICA